MSTAVSTSVKSKGTKSKRSPSLRAVTTDLWHALTRDLFNFNAYRPEKHYMRGPGPKWRERHARGEILDRGTITLDEYYKAR